MSSDDKLIKVCRDAGYLVEYQKRFDGSEDHGTCVVEFPCETPDGAVFTKDMPVIKQLEMVKKIQSIWADNAVSVTAYYKPSELSEIREWMKNNYEMGVKSVSFLLHSDHGFQQAPYEEITETEYKTKIKKVKSLNLVASSITSGEILDGIECAGGVCPLK
jgi:ribonucleoside-diphosphate reductase alpha chain